MTITHHDDIELAAGDEWEIAGTLLDETGAPLNLDASVNLGWTLLGRDGNQVEGIAGAATLERLDPVSDGKILIIVPDEFTRTLEPGRYMDAVRAWVGDAPALQWVGMILCAADPFHAELIP
jgi:hypothetical protein